LRTEATPDEHPAIPGRAAVSGSYDRLAATYAEHVAGELAHKPFDRLMLDELAARVRGGGPLADVGCGPGHVAAYLRDAGADALGVDLSPAMVALARRRYPDVPFHVGDVARLPFADGAWAGAVAFYSLIHLAREEVVEALREIRRVIRAGGPLLIAFHVGEEVRRLDTLWDVPVDLAFVFFTVEEMRGYVGDAGFVVERCEERDPYPDVEAQTRRCYLLART
jgi:SAM-dependent methyltransferase